jgi:Neutral/alkaline non-lysosomal ceramidase, N-terminal
MDSKNTLIAGAAAVDITPLDYRNVYLAGFDPNRKAQGVLDPIYVRAIYLNDGENAVAIVVCDLIGLLLPTTEWIRKAVGIVPPENILLCCTHTHSGPDTLGFWGPSIKGLPVPLATGVDKKYLKLLKDKIVHAVTRAKKKAVPAKISFAEDSSVKDFTWNVRDPGFIDHALSVMRIDRVDNDRVIAILTNYASHPEVLWGLNKRISPDYPVMIHRTLERKYGGVSVFVSGALGAMVTPGLEEDARLSKRESFYADYGHKVARVAVSCVEKAKQEKDPKILVRTTKTILPLENPLFSFAVELGLFDREISREGAPTTVSHLQIGGAHFAGIPGEASPAFGFRVKKAMKGGPNFLLGLCNDEIGYILERRMFEDGKYEYEQSMSVGPESADRILDAYTGLASK